MFPYAHRFFLDDRGSVLVSEWVFLATILMIGILPAIAATQAKFATLRASQPSFFQQQAQSK